MSATPGGVTARVRGKDGWAVRGAVLTGTYTAIVIAPGYQPVARTVVAAAGGAATLGTITLDRTGGAPLPPPVRWTIDPAHSSVTVTTRHMGMASISGSIGEFSGTIEIAEPIERSTVQARMHLPELPDM